MGSQFVDLNADGHLDYLTATFDGSVHVAYGSEKGYATPVHLKDAAGERIIIASIWNDDARKHESLGRSMPDGTAVRQRCISALAFDWDADGDFDLLLGSYEEGRLYRQMNEGTNKEPKFTGKNIAVNAGGKPFALPAKMTAPRLVDWDGDGDLDLVTGTFGDSWGEGMGGGVYLARNVGKKGRPEFAALETLIEPAKNGGGAEPVRPNAGLYPEVTDYDGDGDLDLIVGAYSMWMPPARELNEEEQARAKELAAKRNELQQKAQAVYADIRKAVEEATKGMEQGSEEWRKTSSEIWKSRSADTRKYSTELRKITTELNELVPARKREAFVWFYERVG